MPTTSPSPPRSRSRLRAGAIQGSYPSIGVHLEGDVDGATAELLHEFVHSHTPSPVEELPDPFTYETGGLEIDKIALEAQRLERVSRPWWQRPSATWYIVLSPLSMLAVSALIAPRLQLYTSLMCNDLYAGQWVPTNGGTNLNMRSLGSIPCAADPVVQANVAKFLTITATVQGILSCLTATFWGSFSDRFGRVKFLSLNITTLLLSEAALAALVVAPEYVPGGYWLILITSAFEGLFGGRSAAIAAVHAYLADCTDPATRSRIFSRYLGLIFIGVAFGPSLGGLAQRLSGNPNMIFYVALGLHVINALFQWFIIPESLLPAQMDAARRARGERSKGLWFSRMFSFLGPLTVLAPLPLKGGANPQKALQKDWSLTWLALSSAPESLVIGSMQYWFQYVAGRFNWTAETVGYYITVIGLTRALFLMIGLPAILHFFVPRSHPVQLPTSPDEPLNASSSLPPTAPAHDPAPLHTPGVDLGIARASLALQAICFVLIAVSKDAGMYVTGSALGALAAGYAPTMQSLSLELYTRRGGAPSEAGRLFGAMSVIQTIGNQVVGPSLFGIIYIKTVATFPEAIFYVIVVVVLLSLFFLFLVRIPPHPGTTDAEVEAEAEGPLVIDVPTVVVSGE